MKKTIILVLIIPVLFLNSYAQTTWEFYHKKGEILEQADFIEEIKNKNLVSVSSSINGNDLNSLKPILRIHDKDTGEVLKEAKYGIDTLGSYFTWIFYSPKTDKIVCVGSAIKKYTTHIKGCFLLTVWDTDLNLLKETLFRMEPSSKNFYIDDMSGNYALNGDFILVANTRYGINTSLGTEENELILRIDQDGNILRKRFRQIYGNKGIHSSIVEYEEQKYIVFGLNPFILDSNFVDVELLFTNDPYMYINDSSVRKFKDNNYLAFIAIGDLSKRGVGIFNNRVEPIKTVELCKPNSPYEYGNYNRIFDFIDSSAIYVSIHEITHRYYYLTKLNSNLEIIWVKYFYSDDIAYGLSSIEATSDGGCVIVGSKGFSNDGSLRIYEYGAWMKKFDADGNSVGTESIPKSNWEITVFPNPSQGDFKIEIGGEVKDIKLILYDMQGREIKIFNELTSGINYIDMHDVSEGMYIWKLEKEGKILGDGKWVKR